MTKSKNSRLTPQKWEDGFADFSQRYSSNTGGCKQAPPHWWCGESDHQVGNGDNGELDGVDINSHNCLKRTGKRITRAVSRIFCRVCSDLRSFE